MGISSNIVILGGSCFLLLLVTWDLIELYLGHIRPKPWEISSYLRFIFTLKGIELFKISSVILFFTIDLAASNLFSRWLCESSYSKIWFSLFKIMKDGHLFNVLYSVHLYFFLNCLSFWMKEINLYFLFKIICSFSLLVLLISISWFFSFFFSNKSF